MFLLASFVAALLLAPASRGAQLQVAPPAEGSALASGVAGGAQGSILPTQLTSVGPSANAAPTVTNITIEGNTKVQGARRLGINLGGQTFYDSGQILRNLVFRNPGFEAETFRTILHCATATATSCTDTNIYAVWPANFVKNASFQFIYGKALGASGTINASSAASYAGKVGVKITFNAIAHAPAAGDFVELQMTVPGNAQAGWWPSTSGGASMATDSSDLSPQTPGKQALRINASGLNQTAEIASYFDSYAGRSFVQLHGTYDLSFRAKGVGGSNEVSISLYRATASGNRVFFSQTVILSPTWENYSFSFPTSENGSSLGTIALKFDLARSSMLLDDVSLSPAPNGNNPTVFRDEVVSTLKTLQPGVIRYQDSNGAGLGSFIDNAIAVPFARVRTAYSQQETERDDITLGLYEFLQLCHTVGAEPWYNVPVGVSPTEMQNLIEYLAGSASTPYGAKRAARGQVIPWSQVFPRIHLELGNEAWNDAFYHGASMPDPVAYGRRAATIFAAARKSPDYSSGVFDLVLGSWAAVPYWTSQEMANSGSYDTVDAAPYLFNSFNDASSVEHIYGPMFAQPESVDSVPTGSMYQQAQAAKATGVSGVKPANLAVYEVNLAAQTGSATQSQVNAVIPSFGSGLAVVEHMLLMMRDLGITVQNMFSLPEYSNPFQNTKTSAGETAPLFGAVVDMGGQTNLRRPVFLAEQLANTAILPDLLTTSISGANPTWNQALSSNDEIAMNGAHYIQAFAFSDGGKNRSLVLFNLSRTQSLPITTSGAGAPSGTLALTALTSANLTDTNESSSKVQILGETIDNYRPGSVTYLPPYSMVVVKWAAE